MEPCPSGSRRSSNGTSWPSPGEPGAPAGGGGRLRHRGLDAAALDAPGRHRRRHQGRPHDVPSRPRSCSSGETSVGSRWRTRSCGGRPPTSPRTTPKMRFPLVRELAADRFPVRLTCGVLGFSTQALLQVAGEPGLSSGPGRRPRGERHRRHPPRRSGVRLPLHLRRAGACRGTRWARPGPAGSAGHRIWSVTTKKGRRGSGKTPDQPSTTIWSSATSPPVAPTRSG